MRLDIPAGTAVRFEPGQKRSVNLVAYAGARVIHGFNCQSERQALRGPWPTRSPRGVYADMFGPTVGDRVRLADTELFIEVEARPHRPMARR